MGETAAKRYLEIMESQDGISKQILFMPTIYERTSIKNISSV
jgi:DNA-binding LacI/PurR family transcriptional regulator